jgi:hypothetical protein
MNGTYFAKPVLSADNELRQKNVEIDLQASDVSQRRLTEPRRSM